MENFDRGQVYLLIMQVDPSILGVSEHEWAIDAIHSSNTPDIMQRELNSYRPPFYKALAQYAISIGSDRQAMPARKSVLLDVLAAMKNAYLLCKVQQKRIRPLMPSIWHQNIDDDLMGDYEKVKKIWNEDISFLWSIDHIDSSISVIIPGQSYDRRHHDDTAIHFLYSHGWLFLVTYEEVQEIITNG